MNTTKISSIAFALCIIAIGKDSPPSNTKSPNPIEVPIYVNKSDTTPAAKPHQKSLSPILCTILNAKYPENEPSTPIEKILTPRVVSPPCARKSACINNAIPAITTLTKGPNNIALIPVPAGCAVAIPFKPTTGIGKHEKTNTAAPTNPTNGKKPGTSFLFFFSLSVPTTTKGIIITTQNMAHFGGRIPSVICIACATCGNNNKVKTTIMPDSIILIMLFSASPSPPL